LQAANDGKMKDDAKDSPKGEPKKGDKKIPPKEEPKADDPDERRAKLRLDLAMKNLEEAEVERGRGNDEKARDKQEKAREHLQEATRLYPKTKAAEEAKTLLDKLN
jgi:hypothetical protein